MPLHQPAGDVGAGTIDIDGQPLPAEGRALARLRADVGMVFQSFNLFGHRTVLDNIILGPTRVRRRSPPRRGAGAELLDRVGIADKANNYPAQLSGGQQQRVAIARALAMQPKVCSSTSRPRPSTPRWSTRCST